LLPILNSSIVDQLAIDESAIGNNPTNRQSPNRQFPWPPGRRRFPPPDEGRLPPRGCATRERPLLPPPADGVEARG
jgi:hypothetical protein